MYEQDEEIKISNTNRIESLMKSNNLCNDSLVFCFSYLNNEEIGLHCATKTVFNGHFKFV